MAQHDYNLANQSGADFRADLNNALEAIATVNSGATEPSTTFAHQLWVDTANSVLKIRNAANSDWITFGVSISSSNVFTGDLTGNVVGNVTGDLVGNVTGDLTGNADSADILSTARTISLSGDVVGSVSFDGSANVDIDTVVQINSITLGTDTTGDYVESISGGTGVTITGGTGESSTPVVAIGQAVGTGDNVTFNLVTATNEFIGALDGAIRFTAKADEALSKGDVVYVSGVSGNTTTVGKAKADDSSKMPAFGLAIEDANNNNNLQIVTFGNLTSIDTSNLSVGEIIYVSTTAGEYTTTPPAGESAAIQNIGKVLRSHQNNGSIKVGGAGRSNATGNLNDGNIFIGNASNQASTSALDTSIVPENTNLYWTTARGESMFDTRLATKDTGDLAEGSNLYYTTARVNSDFDTRLATKDTGDLAEGTNLYYTTARVNSDFDTRLATKDTDDVSEGSVNLYYTSSRANSDFDTRLATKDTGDLTEGVNLYYTDARFDTRLATKDTDDLTEGTNLYYTQARFDSAFSNKTTSDLTEGTNLYYTDARANSAIDTRVTKSFVDALNIQAASVDANSVALGTDTTGNYIQTITGTANKITVTGSGSESADVTLTLPDDVQIADSLTVAGNLTVNGTLTSLDTTNLDIEDNLFQLNAGLTGSPVNDSGMLINRGDQDNGIFMWDESADKFTLGLTTADGTATGNITLNSLGTLVANIEGNINGNVTGTVSDISNHSTSDLTEGSNLYYTDARANSAFDTRLATKDTGDLTEGSNLYYTDARADARVNLQTGANLDLSSKSTSDLSEGTNEYFTTARARSSISASGDISYNSSTGVISFTAAAAPVTSVNTFTGAVVLDSDDISEGSTNLYYTSARFDSAFSGKSTSDLSEGTNLYYTDARADARVNLQTGANLDLSSKSTSDLSEGTNLYYTDARFDTRLATKDTDDISEGASNLYYTDARSRAAVSVSGDLAYDSGTGVFSFTERTDAEVQALITAGTGVTVSGGQVSIGQAVATSDSPTFANMTLSGTGSIKVPSGTTAQRDATPANGMFRYNSEDAQFEGYADGAWGAIAGGGAGSAMETNNFTGDGSTTAFTLSSNVSDEDNLLAFIEGVYQNKADFVASGTTITFDTAPANGRNIVVHHVKSNIGGSNVILNSFTGNSSDTDFTLSVAPQSENNTQVHLDGVYQNKSTYSVSGTTLTFDAAPANGVEIEVIMFTQTTINEPAANTVGITQLDVSDGTNGQALTTDGSGTLSFADVEAATVSATAPSSPAEGDMWFNSSTSTVSNIDTKCMAVWNGTEWRPMSQVRFAATGGTITTSGDYTIHTFTTSGIFTPNQNGVVEYLVVGGGGGSGSGGGGAGGYRTATNFAVAGNSAITVTVGAGGASGAPGVETNGGTGGSSSFSEITSAGGGYGARLGQNGQDGGSGGGGGGTGDTATTSGGSGNTPSTSPSQGNDGGGHGGTGDGGAGGGGGAGGAGVTGTNAIAGNGGLAQASSITGSSVYYAGGGGGGGTANSLNGLGGGTATASQKGGAGDGAASSTGTGVAGTANTGGGAGGGGFGSGGLRGNGAAGGSGIVIVRYLT